MKLIATMLLLCCWSRNQAQSLGGSTVFSFLDLAPSPQLTALGGLNPSHISSDAGPAFFNPALLRPSMHEQLNASFNSFYAGIGNYFAWMPWYNARLSSTLAAGVDFFDYGSATQTDASGNIMGDLHPVDYCVQLSASRRYERHWYYGASLKFIHSSYGIYRSSGAALDIGINYYDSARRFQIGFTARNMGIQFKPYAGTARGELPLDMDISISKRLEKAPFMFSLTAHHLQLFNISYSDTAFNNANGYDQNNKGSSFTVDKLLRHLIAAVQILPEDRVEVTLAYNYLRRKELNIGDAGNGLTGFSMGAGVLFKNWQIRYARSLYNNSSGYNQFGLSLRLND